MFHFSDFLVYSEKYLEPKHVPMMDFFGKTLKHFRKKKDVSLNSKYVYDTFVNFIVVYRLLHIILDFYMDPRS